MGPAEERRGGSWRPLLPSGSRAPPRLLLALLLHASTIVCCVILGRRQATPRTRREDVDCTFSASYPRTYVAHRVHHHGAITVDGKLDEPAWADVAFSEDFVDISTTAVPPLRTRVKIRWDDDFLYVGALMEETQLAANITWCCHCVDPSADQVIFHDNDFEVFVDADGSNHHYKEFEMNGANSNGTTATWDLLLPAPYDDRGGGENSSRVYGDDGWDMIEPRGRGNCASFSDGALNDPTSRATFWSAEIALPLDRLAELTTAELPGTRHRRPPAAASGANALLAAAAAALLPGPLRRIAEGALLGAAAGRPREEPLFWRINFSRVQWGLEAADGRFVKRPACMTCPEPGSPAEDNWVWSPQGAVAMHRPESWGFLQFSDAPVNSTPPQRSREWGVRSAAMAVYYAQRRFSEAHGGAFAATVEELLPFTDIPEALDGTCFEPLEIRLTATQLTGTDLDEEEGFVGGGGGGGLRGGYVGWIRDGEERLTAAIRDDRYLRVFSRHPPSSWRVVSPERRAAGGGGAGGKLH